MLELTISCPFGKGQVSFSWPDSKSTPQVAIDCPTAVCGELFYTYVESEHDVIVGDKTKIREREIESDTVSFREHVPSNVGDWDFTGVLGEIIEDGHNKHAEGIESPNRVVSSDLEHHLPQPAGYDESVFPDTITWSAWVLFAQSPEEFMAEVQLKHM